MKSIKKIFPRRKKDSHKGDFGRVFILAGSTGLTGAAYLAAMGCARSGAGLVTLGVPESVYSILAVKLSEVMVRPFPSNASGSFSMKGEEAALDFAAGQDALAVGPGIGPDPEAREFARKAALGSKSVCVLDADGLNAFEGKGNLLLKLAKVPVLTPHPVEAERLFGHKPPSDDGGRAEYVKKMALRYRCVLLLKGHHTVVASPQGEIYMNKTGNPGMATGGAGDVLTGMIAAFLGQSLSPYNAAVCGAYIHGVAGDLALRRTGEISLLAGDILHFLPKAFKKALSRS